MRRTAGNVRSPRVVSRGFTLAELLVALTLGGVVAGSMLTFFMTQLKTSRLAGVRIEAVQRSRFAFELMRREISLAGAGIPDAQPLVVFAGPDDFVFSADLGSATPGDRVAMYQLPNAPPSETEGPDSASMILPNGQTYPQAWYGPGQTSGPAETVRFSFVASGDDSYSLVRATNNLPGDTLLRGLTRIGDRDFFTYQVVDAEGKLNDMPGQTVWHEAAIHESQADTSRSALADSIKLVEIAFTVNVRGRRYGESVERSYAMGVALNNAGLIRNAACGGVPQLGVTPAATVVALNPPTVRVTWPPAIDETAGEMDVQQYTLYRKLVGTTMEKPIASLPPDPDVTSYIYMDSDVELGLSYVYGLVATDCTPAMSGMTRSAAVTVSTP